MAKNPNWTREEEIIALDYYFRIYHEGGSVSELTQEASNLLRAMPNSKNAGDKSKFRNNNSVNKRMGNFQSLDPDYEGLGLTNVGKQTIAIWNEFQGRRDELSRESDKIRRKYSDAKMSSPASEEVSELDDEAALGLKSKVDSARDGAKKKYYTTKYERKPKNRKAAIKAHGAICQVCGFDFEEKYGDLGKGFIEVHHIMPLSSREEEVEINPAKDLACVCSNCHKMIHRRRQAIVSLDELREIIELHK